MNPIIEIRDLTCRFGPVTAVRNLSLAVPEGCVYALLGTNGAGKSTTLKALLNLVTPSSGVTRILGVDSANLTSAELARIGYVSENQALPEYLTVPQLIAHTRALYPTWDDALCDSLQKLFALPQNRKIKDFSRGMKIKTAILISLAYRPSLLILDEPFSGLDVLVRDQLIQGILEISDRADVTILISTHDVDEIERLADWVGVMDKGKLAISESLESLRARFQRVDLTVRGEAVLPDELPESAILPEALGSSVRWIESRYTSEAETAAQVRQIFPDTVAVATSPLSLRDILLTSTQALRSSHRTTL